jgi:uridine kinase
VCPPTRVVVLAGPSGAGKSRLAGRLSARHDWPIVRLDDFYREGDDPDLPMLDRGTGRAGGIPDWDDPRSWDHGAAVAALLTLARTGVVDVPDYDISRSRRVGHSTVRVEPGRWILAEGIFAARVVADLGEAGLLAAACCIRNNRWLTFWRRLVRDLAEHRKPPLVLWHRGLRLCRDEPRTVAAQVALGARAMTARQAEQEIEALLADRPSPGPTPTG